MRRLLLPVCLLLLSACEGSALRGQLSESGSGAIAAALSGLPPVPTATDTEKDLSLMERILSSRSDYAEKRLAARSRCEEELRRANRDTKWEATLDCVRADYQLEAAELGQLKAILLQLSNASPSPATARLRATADDLQQALVAIVDGIDNGVYEEEETLLESKKLLHTQYRTPYWQATVALLTERLGWQLRRTMEHLGETDPSVMTCLASCAEDWRHIPANDVDEAQSDLSALHTKIRGCLDAPRPLSATGTTVEP